ncbi:MAG: SGNH/GDSL hydrolase family protein [Rudaea sp.]
MPTPAPHRFLALGDSYTIGDGVAERDRWPVQLAAALRQRDISIEVPEILAQTGWTTDELDHAMRQHPFHPPYALVTLLIGVNNQYRARDLANYRKEFGALLARAIDLAGGRPQHVIAISIPDWGVTRFGRESGRDPALIAQEIDLYNATNAQLSQLHHVHYVDVSALSRTGGDAADMLVDDGLHPSAAMYRHWTAAILAAAQRALSSH